MKQHFIIEGRYLGTAERGVFLEPKEVRGCRPLSIILFCDKCGDPWARFPVESSDGHTTQWQAYAATCRKHLAEGLGYAQRVPGSVLIPWDADLKGVLPLSVLLWEFQRELDYYDWTQNGET
jgi:hypothetical protein